MQLLNKKTPNDLLRSLPHRPLCLGGRNSSPPPRKTSAWEATYGPLYVSGKLPTYSSPKPKRTLTLPSYLGRNVGLGVGVNGQFPRNFPFPFILQENPAIRTSVIATPDIVFFPNPSSRAQILANPASREPSNPVSR